MAAPQPPTNAVATAGNRRATVTFTPPDDDGGFLITSYTVTASDDTTPANGGQTATGANPPITVVGLTDGDDYYFTVTATNSAGTSGGSSNSNTVEILPPREPDAPTAVSATAGDGEAIVTFVAPTNNGGAVVTAYEVTAVDETNPGNGGQTQSGSASPLTVAGLSNGDGYTFQVTATNSEGTSDPSAKSSLVVPQAETPTNTPPPPFPNGASFPLERPINLVQLQDEIAAAVGQAVQVALTGDYDINQPLSPSNAATLWVAPDSISSGTIIDVIGAHVPNPAYGMSGADLMFQAALQKVQSDPNAVLTDDEMQGALRGLLIRSLIRVGPIQ
jgi:hypothetical protein